MISCYSPVKDNKLEEFLNTEIKQRLAAINTWPNKDKDLVQLANKIDKKSNDLILISKDVENISASVNMGNEYFEQTAEDFSLNGGQMIMLTTLMQSGQISNTIKENELTLLNRLIFLNTKTEVTVYTAR